MSKILAIDTSCDDTSAAVVEGVTVRSNVIASQTQLHKQYGGVFPTVAKQAHKENIDPVVLAALQKAGLGKDLAQAMEKIDAVAVTVGPGLAPALEVGIRKAKELVNVFSKPLLAVNHIESHALSILAQASTSNATPAVSLESAIADHQFPVLSMVVSGGHTDFILIKKPGEYERIGWTIDDAAGEALDKVGRMLGLGYPAGPVMETFAKQGDELSFDVPLPMTDRKDGMMSFSGLKTFARNKIEELEDKNALSKQTIYDFTASFQYGVFRHICYKLNIVLQNHDVNEIWLGGGVAANTRLRRMIRETTDLKLYTPYTKKLCMDNAAMIGVTGGFMLERGEVVTDLEGVDRKPRLQVNK